MGATGSAGAAPVLETRALVRKLGALDQVILHGLDLRVARGEFVALVGASGSGKSTLLYLLGALDRPSSGQVLIDGVDASALDDGERARLRNERLGFVFQFHFLLPEFSAAENIMIPLLRRGLSQREARQRAQAALQRLGIAELAGRRPGKMSGGQQQRVSIARAIAGQPAILLADEPTGNLDSVNGEIVIEEFEKLSREGMTIVMVTHNPDYAARASRQIVLKDGRIVSDVSAPTDDGTAAGAGAHAAVGTPPG
ncbi:MAG: ABC transporter ATP-binding protein [Deltaproteobacteria bacterium]|nr:ABC transporter ATP-binding protein [Deltaproteobacteria bacterium]